MTSGAYGSYGCPGPAPIGRIVTVAEAGPAVSAGAVTVGTAASVSVDETTTPPTIVSAMPQMSYVPSSPFVRITCWPIAKPSLIHEPPPVRVSVGRTVTVALTADAVFVK